jgi:hypothetical protein
VVGALWLVAAVCVLLAVVVNRDDDGADAAPEPTQDAVRLEPVTYRSASPFTPSVISTDLEELPGLVERARAASPAPSGPVDGHAALLYASRGSRPVCDRAALERSLGSDPALAAAWATAAGVPPADVTATLQTLTPVVLTADTAVTNHIYRSGKPRAYQAVLQAGTPVMVDPSGSPRVQCSCGNPLGQPAEQPPTALDGDRWDSFDRDSVVAIAPAAAPTSSFTTVDLDTAQPSTTATGSNIALGGTLVAASDGLHVATAEGEVAPILDEAVDTAYDDGRGGVVFTRADPGNRSRNQRPVASSSAGIWHLPAGTTEAVEIVPPRPGGWNRLLTVSHLGGRTSIIYLALTMDREFENEEVAVGSAMAKDLDSGVETVLVAQAAGWEFGVAVASDGGDRLALALSVEAWDDWAFFGPGLQPLPTRCAQEDLDVRQSAKACPGHGVLDEAGRLVALSDQDDPEVRVNVVWADPVTGEKGQGANLAEGAGDGEYVSSPQQARAGKLVISTPTETDAERWQIIDLSNGAVVSPNLGDRVVNHLSILTAPIIRPVESSPATAPPSAPTYRAPTLEEAMAAFPSAVCDSDAGPIALDDEGTGESTDDYTSERYIGITLDRDAVATIDVDGDGTEELVASPMCNWGGSGYSTPIAALRMGPAGLEVLGAPYAEFGRESRAVETVTAVEGGVQVAGGRWLDDDAACCPSATFTATMRLVDGRWVEG